MRRSKLVPLFVALLLAVSLTGCLGSSNDMTDREQQLQDKTISALSNADTYDYSMDMTVQTEELDVEMSVDATVDRPNRKIRATNDMEVPMRGNVEMETYLVGETMYINSDTLPEWRTRDASELSLWDKNDQLKTQRQILESSEIDIVGSDTVDGNPVTVLKVEPDEGTLKDSVGQLMGSNLGDVTIEEATYRYSVENSTNRPLRVDLEMDMKIRDRTATATGTMRYSDFGQNVSISLPEEARKAADS